VTKAWGSRFTTNDDLAAAALADRERAQIEDMVEERAHLSAAAGEATVGSMLSRQGTQAGVSPPGVSQECADSSAGCDGVAVGLSSASSGHPNL